MASLSTCIWAFGFQILLNLVKCVLMSSPQRELQMTSPHGHDISEDKFVVNVEI